VDLEATLPPQDADQAAGHVGVASMARLLRIAEAVRGTPDGEWFGKVVGRYAAQAAEGVRIDEVLRLAVPPGGVPWWTERRRAERDARIRELAAGFAGSPTSRALAAAEAMRRYQSAGWRHDKARGGPLTPGARRKTLFAIFCADGDPPLSMRRVYDIVRSG
jgi:hypothetical protein